MFSCGSPKQRVYKGNNSDSNFYLNFDKIFALSSLHLQHVTKGTDLPKLTLSLRQERKNENNQTLSNVSSCEQKSRRKFNNARKVPVVSVKALTIDHDISWETCLSFARCVEGKQRLNKDIFVLAFVNLDEIPISQAYKRTDISRPNHISLRISKGSAKMKSLVLLLFLGATVALAEIHVGDDSNREQHRKILVSLNSLIYLLHFVWSPTCCSNRLTENFTINNLICTLKEL